MKCLARNKRAFTYCTYKEKVAYTDSNGHETGEYTVKYNNPKTIKGYITANKSEASLENFGVDLKYDRIIILDDPNCEISETTVLFIDKSYEEDASHNPLFDYTVKKVARSLNAVSIAIGRL